MRSLKSSRQKATQSASPSILREEGGTLKKRYMAPLGSERQARPRHPRHLWTQ